MDSIVEQEFRRIRENLGRNIEVTTAEFEYPPAFGPRLYSGRLDEFIEYKYIKIFMGVVGIETVQKQFPFVGSGSGIALIRDEQGQTIYQNEGLVFTKPRPLYTPFFDPVDNEAINLLRRAKFGEGHDFKLME